MTIKLFSAAGSGGVAVEAALTLLGMPFDLVEAAAWGGDAEAQARVAEVNPMRQVPALVLESGETLTESGAILIYLADAHPAANLAPPIGDLRRGQFLRWMFYVSSAIYAHYWAKDDPTRLGVPENAAPTIEHALNERIAACWAVMNAQIEPGRYLLGDDLSVLDLYVAVVSRFRPRRQRFYAEAPKLKAPIERVDADPRLKDFWAARYPFEPGWDVWPAT